MLIPSNSYLLNRANFNILHVITWLLYIPLYILPKPFLLEKISSFNKISLIGNKVVFYFNFLNFLLFEIYLILNHLKWILFFYSIHQLFFLLHYQLNKLSFNSFLV